MTRSILASGLLLAVSTFGARAHAQVFEAEGEATYEEDGVVYEEEGVVYQDEGVVYQDEGVVYQEQPATVFVDQNGQPVQQQQVEAQQPERLARQASVYGSVPMFLSNVRDEVTPGVGLHARVGWEFGLVVPEVQFGIQTNFFKSGSLTDANNLSAFWFSLGARLQMLNASRFVPFVSAAVHFTWWGINYADVSSDYAVDPGLGAAAGLALELTQNFGLEAAISVLVNFPAQITFESTQIILRPWVGGTLYF